MPFVLKQRQLCISCLDLERFLAISMCNIVEHISIVFTVEKIEPLCPGPLTLHWF